jgi:uncharacterized membrane protein YebE (DUF533 family)
MDAGKLLGSLLGKNSMNSNVLSGLLGGGGKSGGIGGMLSGLLGGGKSGGGGGGLGALLGGLMGGGGAAAAAAATPAPAPQAAPEPLSEETNSQAELLIRAMCNAAKSDGKFDDAEKDAILGRLGEIEPAEIEFLRNELAQPLDVQGFANDVPSDLASQVYAFSVMAIKLDEQSEAQYLAQLAQGLRLDPATCNDIHEQVGAPQIFRA